MVSQYQLTLSQRLTLASLANAIIPADQTDAGAAAVGVGERLSEKICAGINAPLYLQGLEVTEKLSQQNFAASVDQLTAAQAYDLVAALRDALPAFFKQLRLDVSAIYLSDPAVWQRIGFAGPLSQTGGHPDFDRPQSTPRTS